MNRNIQVGRWQKVIDLKKLWKNDYFKTAVAIALIVAIIVGFSLACNWLLDASVPIRVVESGSMCVPYGWQM